MWGMQAMITKQEGNQFVDDMVLLFDIYDFIPLRLWSVLEYDEMQSLIHSNYYWLVGSKNK